MIRIGGVSIDVSHPKAFAMNLEKYCMNMRYSYICNPGFRTDEEVAWFHRRFKLDGIVENIEDMVDYVDVGFIQSCNWEKHLDHALPFLKKGKPVFIDKPIVGSMVDIDRLRQLVAGGAKIMGSSSVRYSQEVQDFLKCNEEDRGKILTIYGTSGVDEFNYSIHIVEVMSALAGAKATQCQYVGEVKTAEKVRCQNYVIGYENGIQGIYSVCEDVWQPFVIVVVTTKSVHHFEINLELIYFALLQEIYREIHDHSSRLADIETLINCTQIMLCGKKSRDEKDGAVVRLDDLSRNDKFDGYAFEKRYEVIANRNIYKG